MRTNQTIKTGYPFTCLLICQFLFYRPRASTEAYWQYLSQIKSGLVNINIYNTILFFSRGMPFLSCSQAIGLQFHLLSFSSSYSPPITLFTSLNKPAARQHPNRQLEIHKFVEYLNFQKLELVLKKSILGW